ncbi:MAG: DNA-directed RNA polymerase subunit B, partial [Methanotrichaceae archaeon]|nr:DNA-directed RNA polymerase subunit B [Methanotrichaceae archaeon]
MAEVGGFIEGTRVFVNGEIIGHHLEPKKLVDNIRRLRRASTISSQINVAYFEHTNEIVVNTDSGRARRPLIVVEKGCALVTEGHIEQLARGDL